MRLRIIYRAKGLVRDPKLNMVAFKDKFIRPDAFSVDANVFMAQCFLKNCRGDGGKFGNSDADDFFPALSEVTTKLFTGLPQPICIRENRRGSGDNGFILHP